jgi:DNA modification methylase
MSFQRQGAGHGEWNLLPKPYYQQDGITIYHADCREILPHLPKVDLVLTDPPYGIGKQIYRKNKSVNNATYHTDYGDYLEWDKKPIAQVTMDEIISKGERACIWGGNYYHMEPSSCWLIWDKEQFTDNFADAELAWTNYDRAVRIKKCLWCGMIRKNNEKRFHPTQKPVEIMAWAMSLARTYNTILDPFMGSGTTLVAAKQLHRQAIGIEIEERYCEIAVKRLGQGVLPL